jgi:hypothetical protein
MKKVFLGGTVNGSKWRDEFMEHLTIDYFNPVVDDWNEEAQKRELQERENCDFCLYVITPKITGFYAIAEVADDSNKRAHKTVFCYIAKDEEKEFSNVQIKSLEAVGKLVTSNGAKFFKTLNEVWEYLNNT